MAPKPTFEQARRALESIGIVEEADEDDLFLKGNTAYKLQTVHLKVSISAAPIGSVVRVKALADDFWGWGARFGCKRFLSEMGMT